MEESSSSSIVEVREKVMVSSNGRVMKREGNFIKPSSSSSHQPLCSTFPATFSPEILTRKIKFGGWRSPMQNWDNWVQKMASLHESTWRKAGICEAILNSTFQITRNNDLIFELAKRWNLETKSFIFPWGEATITLEDILVLGGFSVLGSPSLLLSLETEQSKKKEKTLEDARKEFNKSSSRKACHGLWMKKFRENPITLHQLEPPQPVEVEHEGFLAFWLSRYVFPNIHGVIDKRVFPIAIELARGNRVALAPAVLASIYRDLSSLKNFILASQESEIELESVNLCLPLQLVQVWVWERFPQLQPQPNLLAIGEPRLARWRSVKPIVTKSSSLLDSSQTVFLWRPYIEELTNWNLPGFYPDKEMWVSDNLGFGIDDEVSLFARFVRASTLVGLDNVEQYAPHRVSRQFGIDQDIVEVFAASDKSPEAAWSDYSKPIKKLLIPSRFSVGDCTTHYLYWWRNTQRCLRTPDSSSKRKKITELCGKNSSNDSASVKSRLKRKKRVESVSSPLKSRRVLAENVETPPPLVLPESHPQNVEETSIGFLEGSDAVNVSPSRVFLTGLKEQDSVDADFGNAVSSDGVNVKGKDQCKETEIGFSGSVDEEDNLTISQLVEKCRELEKSNEKSDSNEQIELEKDNNHGTSTASANERERDGKIQEIEMKILELEDQIRELKRALESLKAAKSDH